MNMLRLAGVSAIVVLSSCTTAEQPGAGVIGVVRGSTERCAALGRTLTVAWPKADTRITAAWQPAGRMESPPGPPGITFPAVDLPEHCQIQGVMEERKGIDGQVYAIRFHLRLPDQWNGRFFMQGGGGTNGELGDAIGRLSGGQPPALAQGYAVLSQDSGHSNALNTVPERGGATAFGFDPLARANYGGDSLDKTVRAAKAALASYYGQKPRYSYFVGCSKGGQEGMALAQQYPDLFDGIVASAPGFSLPKAAVAEAWNTQAFADVVKANGQSLTLASLAGSFSTGDLGLVRDAVLAACDADDGAADGLVNDYRQCTTSKVRPQLNARQCSGDKAEGCLSTAQITALEKVHNGPHTSDGKSIYAPFPWDAGWADMGWRIWNIGSPDGSIPSINVAMGWPSLNSTFSSPPKSYGADPAAYLPHIVKYDFDQGFAALHSVVAPFERSAWDDISARSSNLDRFRQRGGRLIVTHGVSDPVFSINDTFAWWDEVNGRYSGTAAKFARVFPVPGMGHCQGGPAMDGYDAFGALVDWVERGVVPDGLAAKANPMSPWPARERVLCPYPKVARAVKGNTAADGGPAFECTE